MLLFLIVYTAIRERKHAIWLAWAWLAGATCRDGARDHEPVDLRVRRHRAQLGTIGDPNELAALLVVGTAFAVVLFAIMRGQAAPAARRRSARSFLCLFGMFFTVSRGGLVALCVAAGRGLPDGRPLPRPGHDRRRA